MGPPVNSPASARPTITCALCGSEPCASVGEILHPDPALVAGVPINLHGRTFHLLRCEACGFQFKHPPTPEDALLECYRKAEGGHWDLQPDAHERQFDVIAAALKRCAPAPSAGNPPRVLDIGCFNGALLGYLGATWERHGVEPSSEAAELARQRGVHIDGATIDDVAALASFDAALAIDVIEHIPSPLAFFQHASAVLKPGGVLVILTGDTASPAWRWQGSRYWYCSMPEHVSFYCRSALERAAALSGMQSLEQTRLSHIRSGVGRRAVEASKNVGYGLAQRVGWLPTRRLRDAVLHRRAPGWLAARDHLLHVMRRRS